MEQVNNRPRLLIEEWLPIAKIGIESLRERTPMTPFPAPNRLHVWWARRPLVASRAAILASLLPAEADRGKFLHMLGIHGDPVAARPHCARPTREGIRLGKEAYGYSRAFSYTPDSEEREWLNTRTQSSRLHGQRDGPRPDGRWRQHPISKQPGWACTRSPMTSILSPGLSSRRPSSSQLSTDNPCSARYQQLGSDFRSRAVKRLAAFFPPEPVPDPSPTR